MATKAEEIIAYALHELGKPYRYGEEGPAAFDCSGLIQFVYGEAGLKLPRTAAQQQTFSQSIAAADARPGDLVFWGAPAHHVALYLGNGRILSAPHTGAVVHITDVYGTPTYGRVSGVGGVVGAIVDTALVQPVAWGVDGIKKVAGDVGLLIVLALGGASLIGLGVWQAVKGKDSS